VAKKTDIGSKEFTKLIQSLPYQPHPYIIKKLDAKMFSLDLNKVYNYKPEYLAAQEYGRCLSLFQKRNPGQSPEKGLTRYAGVQKLITQAEHPHRTLLQELAIETIKEIYEVPDYVDLKAFIQPRLGMDTEQDHTSKPFLELTLEQKNEMRDEIQKRIILNGLVHGSAMHVWKGIYHLVSQKLDTVNPQLKELYDHYTSSMSIMMWMMSPDDFQNAINDGVQITQGLNTLKFNRTQGFGGRIEAKGINFPTLLHELNKGVIDWLVTAGVPQHYNEAELEYYYAKADSYENEVWHYLLSPTLWNDLLECAKIQNHEIPKLIIKLTKLSYQELVELFRLMMDNKEEATKKIQEWNL